MNTIGARTRAYYHTPTRTRPGLYRPQTAVVANNESYRNPVVRKITPKRIINEQRRPQQKQQSHMQPRRNMNNFYQGNHGAKTAYNFRPSTKTNPSPMKQMARYQSNYVPSQNYNKTQSKAARSRPRVRPVYHTQTNTNVNNTPLRRTMVNFRQKPDRSVQKRVVEDWGNVQPSVQGPGIQQIKHVHRFKQIQAPITRDSFGPVIRYPPAAPQTPRGISQNIVKQPSRQKKSISFRSFSREQSINNNNNRRFQFTRTNSFIGTDQDTYSNYRDSSRRVRDKSERRINLRQDNLRGNLPLKINQQYEDFFTDATQDEESSSYSQFLPESIITESTSKRDSKKRGKARQRRKSRKRRMRKIVEDVGNQEKRERSSKVSKKRKERHGRKIFLKKKTKSYSVIDSQEESGLDFEGPKTSRETIERDSPPVEKEKTEKPKEIKRNIVESERINIDPKNGYVYKFAKVPESLIVDKPNWRGSYERKPKFDIFDLDGCLQKERDIQELKESIRESIKGGHDKDFAILTKHRKLQKFNKIKDEQKKTEDSDKENDINITNKTPQGQTPVENSPNVGKRSQSRRMLLRGRGNSHKKKVKPDMHGDSFQRNIAPSTEKALELTPAKKKKNPSRTVRHAQSEAILNSFGEVRDNPQVADSQDAFLKFRSRRR